MEKGLGVENSVLFIMKNGGGQDGIGPSLGQHIKEMFQPAGSARRDDRD
jgi:hypothetical protein